MRTLKRTLATIALAMAPAAGMADTTIEVQYPLAFIFDDVFAELKTAFEAEHPDIKVTYRAPYKEYEDGAQTTLRQSVTDQLPDVSMQAINLQRLFVDRGLAVDLKPFIAKEDDWTGRGYSDSMMALGTFGGGTYGMAFAVSTPIIYYNTDLVTKAGGDPDNLPTDWDGVLALAKDIDALGDDVVGIYHSWAITGNWMWQALVFSHGGSMTTEGEAEIAFNDENGQRAMATFGRILDEGNMPDLSQEAARQTFFAGNMGIWTESTSLLRVAEENVGGKFEWKTGPFPLAGPDPRLPTGGNAAMMFAKGPEKQAAAWEFMKFITGPVGATIMVRGTGYAPPNALPADDPAMLKPFYDDHPNHLTALRQAPYMTPWYAFPGDNNLKIIDVIKDHLQSVANRSVTPQDGVQAMAQDVVDLMP